MTREHDSEALPRESGRICSRCGRSGPPEPGLAYPFQGDRLCRGCATVSVGVPQPILGRVGRTGFRAVWSRPEGTGLEADPLRSLMVGLLDERGLAAPEDVDRLHPIVRRILGGLALFAQPSPTLYRGVLTSHMVHTLSGLVHFGPEGDDVRPFLEQKVIVDTPLPPELQGQVHFPGPVRFGAPLAILIPWRLRFLALDARRDARLEALRSAVLRDGELEREAPWRSLFVDDLELPPRAWTERLTLLVSASTGVEERSAERPRFVPVPRQGLDLGRDRDRKLRVLHYLLSQLDGSLSSNDVEVVHALYADSLSPSHRGWNDLRPTLVARGNVLSEKNVFTFSLPPDVDLRLLDPAARAEIEAVIKRDLFGQVVGVQRPEGMIVPLSPGSTVVSALAADNNPPQVFLARLNGPLEDLEAWDARHGLCGCDACLDVILAALRRVFLLMPFRRSNRRLVYNFLLTYYLLRCRLSLVRRGLLGGPDSEARRQSTPIVPWKTTEFAWKSLTQQRQLVRAGQARFRLLAEGRFHLNSESSRPSVAASSG